MSGNHNVTSLPSSYYSLPTRHIKLSHYPACFPTATALIVVTLNRPRENNAFTLTMANELANVFAMIDIDDRVKAVVVTGSGKMFCAGADLDIGFPKGKGRRSQKVNEQDISEEKDHRDSGGIAALAIHNCRKPTIMAINGSAVGIGMTLTLPATIRVACAKAKVGFVFSRRGLIMEATSSFFLPRLIGHSRALHLTTTGATYQADHPLLSSLFSEVLPTAEQTLNRALELGTEIAQNTSTVSTGLNRELMYRGPASAEATHLLDSALIYGLFGNKENEEGVRSFFEKRKPMFEGSFNSVKDVPQAYPWWHPVDVRPKQRLMGAKL